MNFKIIKFLLNALMLFFCLMILAFKYDYQYLKFDRPFDLGQEFNKSSLDASRWIYDYSKKSKEKVNVKIYGPLGSLVSYSIRGVDNIDTSSPEFWFHWNSLFSIKNNLCETRNENSLEDEHFEFFQSNNGIRHSTFDDYFRHVKGICDAEIDNNSFHGDTVFLWMHKGTRFKNFDCFNFENNKKLPPTFGSCVIHFVSQRHIFQNLKKNDLIVVDSRFYFLAKLFELNKDIELLKKFHYSEDDKTIIFKVNIDMPKVIENINLKAGFSMKAFIDGFKQENPQRYIDFEDKVLKKLMGLNDIDIQNIISAKGKKCFKIFNRDYSSNTECGNLWKNKW